MSAATVCPVCSGWGTIDTIQSPRETCPKCKGRGSVLVPGVCCSGHIRGAGHDGTCPRRFSRSAGS